MSEVNIFIGTDGTSNHAVNDKRDNTITNVGLLAELYKASSTDYAVIYQPSVGYISLARTHYVD